MNPSRRSHAAESTRGVGWAPPTITARRDTKWWAMPTLDCRDRPGDASGPGRAGELRLIGEGPAKPQGEDQA